MTTVPFPGDVSIKGDLRVGGNISPAKARSAVLELAELQPFTIPLNNWQERGDHNNMTPGTGISTGSGTICGGHVSRVGSLIKTEMFIDITGLKDGGTTLDIIGVSAQKNCYIGQIRAAVNGTIVFGQITCLETPATGGADIDFYSTVTEATGTQDAGIAALTGEVAFTNNGSWTGAIATPIALTALPGVGYMYMAGVGTGAAVYTAGQFLLELWGTPATETLNYVPGTHGTNAPSLQTDNCAMNDAAVVYYARGEVQLPAEYVAGQSVEIRLHAGMLTTVADQACTVDIAVYKSDEDSTSTGDLCADAAVGDNMNSVTFADIDFTITPATLSPGDLLDVQITVSADDNATATVVQGCIGSVQLLCDVR